MSQNKKVARKYNDSKNRSKSWEDKESRDMKRDNKRSKSKDDFASSSRRPGANDISWYVPDAQLLRDVANLPWSEQAGQAFPRNSSGLGGNMKTPFPGVAAMKVAPVLGMANKPNDPVNVAAQAIYTDVRHANSGAKNYDPTDLMIYIMSLDSIYYTVSWITRLYATVNMYAMQNKYLPDLLFTAQGVNGQSIRLDIPGFRAAVNSAIMKISTLVIPNSMPIFKRHCFLFNNYYTEGDSIKDQMYLYYPACYYVFKYDSDGKGMLECKKLANANGLTANDLINALNEMVNAIYMEEDFGIMAGDILKAFGEGGIERIGLIPDMIVASPINNYEVLNQFKNAELFGIKDNAYSQLNITQIIDTDYPVSPYIKQFPALNTVVTSTSLTFNTIAPVENGTWTQPIADGDDFVNGVKAMYADVGADRFLVSSSPVVTPEETMVSTRLKPHVKIKTITGTQNWVFSVDDFTYGSEIPFNVTYWGYSYFAGAIVPFGIPCTRYMCIQSSIACPSNIDNNTYYGNPFMYASIFSAFKYHPAHSIMNMISKVIESSTVINVAHFCNIPSLDVDNYTLVPYETLNKMHSIATLGEYNVPRLSLAK